VAAWAERVIGFTVSEEDRHLIFMDYELSAPSDILNWVTPYNIVCSG
jgi:hypothetical protein